MTTYDRIVAEFESVRKEAPTLLNKRGDVAEIYLYSQIGADGVTPDAFAQALVDAKGCKELRMYVNSPGGSVFDAKAMMAQLERFGKTAKVVAVVDGLAASAASFLILAAHEIHMHSESKLMIHLPHAMAAGSADDFRAMADLLEQETESLIRMYTARCGQKCSPEQILEMLKAETFLTAQEALDAGLCDQIVGMPKPHHKKVKASATMKIAAVAEETQRQLAAARINIKLWKEQRSGQPNANSASRVMQ